MEEYGRTSSSDTGTCFAAAAVVIISCSFVVFFGMIWEKELECPRNETKAGKGVSSRKSLEKQRIKMVEK